MPKYLYLWFPVVAAALAGVAVYFVTLAVLHPPSQAEIDKAPSYVEARKSLETGDVESANDKKSYDEVVTTITDDGGQKTAPETPAVEKPEPQERMLHGRKVILRADTDDQGRVWREILLINRHNAEHSAMKNMFIAMAAALIIGYVILGVYFHRMSRQAAADSLEGYVASDPGAPSSEPLEFAEPDLVVTQSDPPPSADAPAPPPELAGHEGGFEREDAPVDIAELDKGWEQSKKITGKG